MKQVEIARMQRLEEIVKRQEDELRTKQLQIDRLMTTNVKLQGANEALTQLILRLNQPPVMKSASPEMHGFLKGYEV
jgi:hypothetical protein